MAISDASRRPTLDQLTFTFVPFAFGVTWALLGAITAPAVTFARTQHLLWVSLVLSAVAIALYLHDAGRRPLSNYWRLTWTFGLIAYLLHFYWGYGLMFGGDLEAVYAAQGTLVAGANLLLTVLWTLEVLFAWLVRSPPRPLRIFRALVHLLVLAAFLVAAVGFRDGTVWWLGVAMAALAIVALFDRWARPGPELSLRY